MANESVLFDICDAKIYEMLTDTAGASGPTYGPAIDIPGVNALSGFDPQITSQELKGDCRVIARQSRIDSMNADLQNAKIALPVLDALYNGELWTSGNDTGFRILGGTESKYFKLEGIVTGTDVGVEQVKFVLYKATLTSNTLADQAVDNYGQPKYSINGIGIDSGPDSAVAPLPVKALMADIIVTAAA